MASRILSQIITRRAKYPTRNLSTLTLAEPNPVQIVDLSDTERLFSSIPTGSLVKSLAIHQAMAVGPAVDLGIGVMRSRLVTENRAVRSVLMGAVRRTVYKHFCAGEGPEEVGQAVQELWARGLRGVLDYGSEDAVDNRACERNLHGFLNMVKMTSAVPPSSVSFACVKITAICPISLLERMSDLLRWEKKDPSLQLPWKSHSMPILSESSPLYQTPSEPEPLTEQELQDLQSVQRRLTTICKLCAEVNLPILIDAEYTSVQPAIDYFTFSAALKFNKDDHPIVFATIQTYLRDAKERMVQAVEAAEREGVSVGFKLVRGAYLTRENQLASSLGVASPIHRSIKETHACYDECASYMLRRVVRGSGSLVLATHNLESGKIAAAKAEELGIAKGNRKVQFSQLMGMADGLSLGLRNAGFQVSKYLPFGPVEQVFPYLLRRAEENRGMLSASSVDRELIRKELKRRLKAAVLRSV